MKDFRELIESCKICNGTGILNDDHCLCWRKASVLATMQEGGFLAGDLQTVIDDKISESYILDDRDGIMKRVWKDSLKFASSGLGLVFHGSGCYNAATDLIFQLAMKHPPLAVGFNKHDATIGAFDMNCVGFLKVVAERMRKMLTTIVCIDSVKKLDDNWDAADLIGWTSHGFESDVFRGVAASRKGTVDRWAML